METLPATTRRRTLLATALIAVLAADASAQSRAATRFARSPDGTRLAFDVIGSGPPVLLLHGGGQTRQAWHDAGYVMRLAPTFRVITMDLRGSGESDAPTTTAAYTIDTLVPEELERIDVTFPQALAFMRTTPP